MVLSIERKNLIDFLIALGVSVIVSISLFENAHRTVETGQKLRQTTEVLDQLEDLNGALRDLDSGQRDFLLRNDETSLQGIQKARQSLPLYLNKIRDFAAGNSIQQDRIPSLFRGVETRLEALRQFVEVRQGQGMEAALVVLGKQASNGELDAPYIKVKELRQEEERLWISRELADNQSTRQTSDTALITFLVQFSTLGFLFWLTRRDVLKRQQAEIELRKKGAQLEEARNDAVSGAKMKSQFLANMSHEIRTPMNGVLGMTEILLETELAPKQREFAETIHASANALLKIINDILDFSKIEAGMLRFESIPFDLHKTVESVIDLFAQAAKKKDLELAVLIEDEVPVSVAGDPFRLRQVITNLLSNAIKFTEKGEVVLRCLKLPNEDGTINVRFEVTDTGTGIAAEDQGLLFNPFVQADGSTTRRFGGTGLGLAICKQLVEGMGGQLGVESAGNNGSTFWFSARFLHTEAAISAAPARGDLSNLRVLLVDDNATNRKILHYQVGSWGMRDSSVASGPHALNVLKQGAASGDPFAIVILDAKMPDLSGFQVAKLIRADPAIAAVKIVLLTSVSQAALDDTLRKEVDACLTKPVKQSQLFDRLCGVVGVHGETVNQVAIEPERPPAPAENPRLSILLAEDNEVNQRVTLYQLRMLEHRVDLATNGREAVELFDKGQYDVVLMDINMPELDGYEATAEIRRLEGARKHTTIVAMTANALPEDRGKCLAAGMDDYLAKPVQMKSLLFALERSIAKPAVLPATDLQSLVLAGIDDILPELISIFLESAPADIQKAHLALEHSNSVGLVSAAHSLKGSCSNFGANRLHELCQELENIGRSGSLAEAAEALVLTEKELNRVSAELLAFLDLQPA